MYSLCLIKFRYICVMRKFFCFLLPLLVNKGKYIKMNKLRNGFPPFSVTVLSCVFVSRCVTSILSRVRWMIFCACAEAAPTFYRSTAFFPGQRDSSLPHRSLGAPNDSEAAGAPRPIHVVSKNSLIRFSFSPPS